MSTAILEECLSVNENNDGWINAILEKTSCDDSTRDGKLF